MMQNFKDATYFASNLHDIRQKIIQQNSSTCNHDGSDGSVFQRPDHRKRLSFESVLKNK